MDVEVGEQVGRVVEAFRVIVPALDDLAVVADDEVGAVVQSLAEAKRLIDAGLLVLARRADVAKVHRATGHGDVGHTSLR